MITALSVADAGPNVKLLKMCGAGCHENEIWKILLPDPELRRGTIGRMPANTQETPVSSTGRQPRLQAASGRRALGGFFLSGVLFSFLGAVLPAWGYHVHSDHGTVGLYFLFLTFGIYAGSQACHWLVGRAGLQRLMTAGSGLACVGLLALSFLSGPQPPSLRMFALFVIGGAGAMVNTAVFHAITPLYEHDPAATINLSGGLFGIGLPPLRVLRAMTVWGGTGANMDYATYLGWPAMACAVGGIVLTRRNADRTILLFAALAVVSLFPYGLYVRTSTFTLFFLSVAGALGAGAGAAAAGYSLGSRG